jgi:hypothetical protein
MVSGMGFTFGVIKNRIPARSPLHPWIECLRSSDDSRDILRSFSPSRSTTANRLSQRKYLRQQPRGDTRYKQHVSGVVGDVENTSGMCLSYGCSMGVGRVEVLWMLGCGVPMDVASIDRNLWMLHCLIAHRYSGINRFWLANHQTCE